MLAKQNYLKAALISLIILVPSISFGADINIAIVDIERVLSESTPGKSAQKKYETEVGQAKKEIDSKRSQYEKLQESINNQKGSLSDSALLEKQEKLISLEKDIKRSFGDIQESLRRKNAQMVSELVKELKVVIQNLGKEKGFSIILEKGGQSVLYTDDSVDITEEVIKKFNSK